VIGGSGASTGPAARVARAVTAGRIAAGCLPGVDTNPVPADWRHVTKIDPEPGKRLPLAYPRYLAHTDAVAVGGSTGVTAGRVLETFDRLDRAGVVAFQEPSGPEQVTRETRSRGAFLAIPQVLNGDAEAFVGALGAGVARAREELAPAALAALGERLPGRAGDRLGEALADSDRLAELATRWLLASAVSEAYVVGNPDSAVARKSGVGPGDTPSPASAKRRTMAAERAFGAEVLYVEYSGRYGGTEALDCLSAVAEGRSRGRVWYGGGVDSRERTEAALRAGADAVVVGDAFHRVADEEADLAAAYLAEHPPGPDSDSDSDSASEPGPGDGPEAWLADRLDAGETAAASYLSTVPGVDDPAAAARRCLVAGLRAHRAVAAGGGSGERHGNDVAADR